MARPDLDLNHFRQRLEELRQQTQFEIEQRREELTDFNDTESIGVSNHPAEEAAELYTRTRGLAIEAEMERELVQIERALARIADGTYGICEVGGEEIPIERLEARPAATLCIVHQRERDQHAVNVDPTSA